MHKQKTEKKQLQSPIRSANVRSLSLSLCALRLPPLYLSRCLSLESDLVLSRSSRGRPRCLSRSRSRSRSPGSRSPLSRCSSLSMSIFAECFLSTEGERCRPRDWVESEGESESRGFLYARGSV